MIYSATALHDQGDKTQTHESSEDVVAHGATLVAPPDGIASTLATALNKQLERKRQSAIGSQSGERLCGQDKRHGVVGT